ncbi:hypothetical protein [Candidatus Anaplasma sp. TIGMIC]|uniref:hypothetical protein n=1 Tax=Candidatus Anaplasma sp. TIGMIC TaxID=3020713 RepID=UPI00232AFE99|nr:hypothetical protein [Candidatus Anaplasma sp. TIGMIC]
MTVGEDKMVYLDFDFDKLEGDSYLGCAYLHINPELAENCKDVFVSSEGRADGHTVDCFTVMEFFPDDYGMTHFRGSGKSAVTEDQELEHEISVSGYMQYIGHNTAMLDVVEYFERPITGDDDAGADFESKIVINKEVYGEIGFIDKRTIMFQNDFMEMVMRTPKEVKNIFKYEILSVPEAL